MDEHKIKYEGLKHRKVYTASDVAATLHVKSQEIAKSLLIKFNKPFETGKRPYAVVVIGADKNIDLKKLGRVVSDWAVRRNKESRLAKPEKGKKKMVDIFNKVAKATIPAEKEMKSKFGIVAAPWSAFGSFYKLPVFIDKNFLKKNRGIFSVGSFEESVRLAVTDFARVEQAMSGSFAIAKIKATPKKGGQKNKKR